MTSGFSTNTPLTRTLILEIALPDFHCENYDFNDPEMGEILREWCEGNLTPEALADAALEDSGLTTPRVNLSILLGSKDGNFLERVKGQIVAARIVPREPDHELDDDERLDEAEATVPDRFSTNRLPPDEWWRNVPCGHPPDPIAWDSDTGYICHCGDQLDARPIEGAPGPIAQCDSCGCHVALVMGHLPGFSTNTDRGSAWRRALRTRPCGGGS